MASTFSNRAKREARLQQVVYENEIISDRSYNLLMGGVVLYGLLVNFILCATVGVDIFYSVSPIAFIIMYLVLAFGGTFIANRSNNAIISFLGYNMVVVPLGILVSFLVYVYGGIGSDVVAGAFFYTVLITAIMILAAALYPQIFSRIGGFLLTALFGALIAGIILSFLGIYSSGYSFIVACIFALYIGFDFWRSQQYPKTADNAVDCALDIYLDIINLFIRILEIMGRSNGGSSRRAR